MKFFPVAVPAVIALALTACSGSGGLLNNPIFGGLNQCNPQTSVQLASPSGQYGFNPNSGQIIIVADGSNNAISYSPTQWNVQLQDTYGDPPITGGPLNPVPDQSGPHPYTTDFYYASSIPALQSGATYNAFLVEPNQNCSAYRIGSFST